MKKSTLLIHEIQDAWEGYALMRPPTEQYELNVIMDNLPQCHYIKHFSYSKFVPYDPEQFEEYGNLKIRVGKLQCMIDVYYNESW